MNLLNFFNNCTEYSLYLKFDDFLQYFFTKCNIFLRTCSLLKFEFVIFFAPLLYVLEKNTILNFDSMNESLKSKNNLKAQAL